MKFQMDLIHILKSMKLPEQIKENEEGNKLFGVWPPKQFIVKKYH
ncbi:hypothetical protein J2X07_000929 [Fictibacillus barbaricus]|uniref:Uncharacterized protein n=1 Tax=Fictibacillus barbaricus TaxID=182136 RepID=A0ABU1TXM7_9BACL|nr:hypothetical protein [Fictibacillus barbaricus]